MVKTEAEIEAFLADTEEIAGAENRRVVEIIDMGNRVDIYWEDPVFQQEGWFEITRVAV